MMVTHWEDLLWRPIHKAKAKMDYHSQHPMDLNFNAGEIIEVLGIENEDWWNGSIPNTRKSGSFKFGSFPKIFVEVVESSSESKNDYQQQKVIKNNSNPPSLPPRKKPSITSNNNNSSYDDDDDNVFNKLSELFKPKSQTQTKNNSSRENGELNVRPATATNFESYEEFDLQTDPLSQCEPVFTEDFEGFFDASVVDFSIIDEYARETPRSETATIKGLSHYLTSVWDYPLYKVRAIFVWIADNISYDCESFYSGNISHSANQAKEVLNSRKAVCAGYSELFYELSKAAGLKNVWKISGLAKGAGYEAGNDISAYRHAWNVVLYEGEYLLIDSTWGAGNVCNQQFTKSFNEFYFMCSPMKMIYSHLPTDPEHQYIQPTISSEEFANLPTVKCLYFENGIKLTKWSGCIAETSNDKISLEFEHTIVEGKIGNYSATLNWKNWKGQDKLAIVQRLTHSGPNGGILYRILCNIPSNGDGSLSIYYFPHGLNEGSTLISQKVKNHGTGSNCKFVQTYNPLSLSVMNPLEPILEYNTKVRFEVNVFGENPTPELIVYDQSFKNQHLLKIVEQNNEQDYVTFVGDVVINCKGNWILAHKKDLYYSIACYEVK